MSCSPACSPGSAGTSQAGRSGRAPSSAAAAASASATGRPARRRESRTNAGSSDACAPSGWCNGSRSSGHAATTASLYGPGSANPPSSKAASRAAAASARARSPGPSGSGWGSASTSGSSRSWPPRAREEPPSVPAAQRSTGTDRVTTRTVSGDPASSPSNSPSCHCRPRNHSGSWTRASSPGRGSPPYDCGSSLVHVGGLANENDRLEISTAVSRKSNVMAA